MSFCACGITAATLLLCLFIPESPTYLVNTKNIEGAKKSLGIILKIGKLESSVRFEYISNIFLQTNRVLKSLKKFKSFN